MLYVGSCRHMSEYKWNFFPGRLHTTKEIIFFIENIDKVKSIIDSNPGDLTNLIFGDIYHPDIKEDSEKIIQSLSLCDKKEIKKLILEISSRSLYYYDKVPLNAFYTKKYITEQDNYDLKLVQLSDLEIENDIKHILELSKRVFNNDVEIHIIPHLNVKSSTLNNYIPKRQELVRLLELICIKFSIKFHDIGKFLETFHNPDDEILELYMNDSTHFSYGYTLVKSFLVDRIYPDLLN